jgi:hypothetical protein
VEVGGDGILWRQKLVVMEGIRWGRKSVVMEGSRW